MFYPAGEEPHWEQDESSEDEFSMPKEKEAEPPKNEAAKPLGIWDTGNNQPFTNPLPSQEKSRDHVFVQTSMANEDFRIAIIKGDSDKVNHLLSSGFDVETRLKGGWTPLMYACENGNYAVIQLLLTSKANPNSHRDTFSALMCLASCKSLTCEDDLVSSAKLLIKEGARVNARDRHYMSSLMYACQAGHVTLAETLLLSGADPNYQDTRGWTALCYVAANGNEALATLLLANGANPGLMTRIGDTPSSIALTTGFTRLSNLLDGKAPPTNDNGMIVNQDIVNVSTDLNAFRQLNDIELFLAGLKLRELEPVFKSHCVDFPRLLTLTDKDLEDMGITQVGVRKTLIEAITDLHKASWKMPDKPFEVRRGLCMQEYSAILCQLVSHINYVGSTAAFLTSHTSIHHGAGQTPIAMVTSHQESQELASQIESVVKAGKKLVENITALEKEVFKMPSSAVQKKQESSKLCRVVKTVGFTFGLSFFGFVVYCLATKKPMVPLIEQACQELPSSVSRRIQTFLQAT